jgi:hypothetical protein
MQGDVTQPISVVWWTLALAWAALMFYLSTRTFTPDFSRSVVVITLNFLHLHVSRGTFSLLHGLLRRLAHLTEYGIFTLLLYGLPGEKGNCLGGHGARSPAFQWLPHSL